MNIYRFIAFVSLLLMVYMNSDLQAQNQDVKHVSAAEFKKIIAEGKGKLVDIRTPAEFKMGHIKGAVMIDFYSPDFKSKLAELDKNKPIYIYCRSGSRTSKTVGLLQQIGFQRIVNLQRGLIDWQSAGFQLVQN